MTHTYLNGYSFVKKKGSQLLILENPFGPDFVSKAREAAAQAKDSANKASVASAIVQNFEERYLEFIRSLDLIRAQLTLEDSLSIQLLNLASTNHTRCGNEDIHKYFLEKYASIHLLQNLSTLSLSVTEKNSKLLDQYYSWVRQGIGKLDSLSLCSKHTKKYIESSIKTFDDDIRTKNLLLRSYVEKPYLLFVVAGQSNAVGTGPYPGYEDASYCGLYWDWTDQKAKALKPLKDPVYRSVKGSAWPSFARKMFEITGRKVIILNIAWGGAAVTNISANSWYQDEKVTSPRRTDATREWADMTAELKAKGIQFEIAGMLWVQGEAECSRVGAGTLAIKAYVDGTLDVFQFFRGLTNSPSLPVYMAQIGYHDLCLTNDEIRKGYDAVRKAQLDLCANGKTALMSSELPGTYFMAGYMTDKVHYSQRGYNSLGASFARFITNHQSFN